MSSPIVHRISLTEFNWCCHDFDIEEDEEYIGFATCGLFTHDGIRYQAHIDHNLNRLPPNPELAFSRDYDSLLAIVSDIPTQHCLTICPLPDLNRTLRSNIHIKHPQPDGTTQNIPVHRIPNLYLGFFGSRHMIHLLFPKLYNQSRRNVALICIDQHV